MKILLDESDNHHILDIALNNDRLYDGCQVRYVPPDRSRHQREMELVGDQSETTSRVWQNAFGILMSMPSDYIIITGYAPNWVRTQTSVLAKEMANILIGHDGKNAFLMPGPPPPLRFSAATQLAAMEKAFGRGIALGA